MTFDMILPDYESQAFGNNKTYVRIMGVHDNVHRPRFSRTTLILEIGNVDGEHDGIACKLISDIGDRRYAYHGGFPSREVESQALYRTPLLGYLFNLVHQANRARSERDMHDIQSSIRCTL